MSEYLAKLFFQPRAACDVAWVRIAIVGGFVWKLLSRDFSVFALAPPAVMDLYPCKTYHVSQAIGTTGYGPVVDLSTFHWLHWFLPFPDQLGFHIIQALALAFCVSLLFFGKGPKSFFAIGTFCVMSYLWGYVWRTGALVDSIFPALQTVLVYCFFREPEAWILARRRCRGSDHSPGNGAFMSMFLLIVVMQYFYAGINKLLDLSPLEWFQFDLIQGVEYLSDMNACGYYVLQGPVAPFVGGQYWMNFVGVVTVYSAELTIPLMYFKRRLIPFYALVFVSFHLISWALNLCFFGNFIIWLALFPVSLIMNWHGQGAPGGARADSG